MAFWQLNFEVYHLHPDPDNPHQELVPPPVFRPATLLFPDQTIRKKSMNSDDEALCASQGSNVSANSIRINLGNFGVQIGATTNPLVFRTIADATCLGFAGYTISKVLNKVQHLGPVRSYHLLGGALAFASVLGLWPKPSELRLEPSSSSSGGE